MMKHGLTLFAIFVLLSCQGSVTTRVLILRHGEKMVGADASADLYPNNIGVMRSWALVPFMKDYAPQIDAIYATPQGIDEENSFRPMEICAGVAAKRGITINAKFTQTQAQLLAQDIRANMKRNQTVLICWEHKKIRDIAAALGVENPPKWPDTDFSSIWELKVTQTDAVMTQTSEQLPKQFSIPESAYFAVPITILKTTYPMQYQQLLNFCPERQCSVDWQTIICCNNFLYQKSDEPVPDTSSCTVTKDQCMTWYGQ